MSGCLVRGAGPPPSSATPSVGQGQAHPLDRLPGWQVGAQEQRVCQLPPSHHSPWFRTEGSWAAVRRLSPPDKQSARSSGWRLSPPWRCASLRPHRLPWHTWSQREAMWHEERKAEALEATFRPCLTWKAGKAPSPLGARLLGVKLGRVRPALEMNPIHG